jgi:hypothetical protein
MKVGSYLFALLACGALSTNAAAVVARNAPNISGEPA